MKNNNEKNKVLHSNGIMPKHKFGQNFISDTNLLSAIVRDGEVTPNDTVLEIGAGEGALTKEISKIAKKTVSFEIDNDLKPILLSLNLPNTQFVFCDALKEELEKIESLLGEEYKIIANLPYYITSPLIFKFLEGSEKLLSMTIMVQKEVAQRIVAKEGGKDYGILSVMIAFHGDAKITRQVSRKMFFPVPNVDSAVVNIKIVKNKFDVNKQNFSKVVKGAFSMRRKTLLNNLSTALKISKEEIQQKLTQFDTNRRAESFSVQEFVEITKILLS